MYFLAIIFSFLLSFSYTQAGLITSLPGAPSVSFNQYSGYQTVDSVNGRALFYYFVESQSNPEKSPLVVWLTGGPGCSSLLGAFTENGPFRPNLDGTTLHLNPYSWNNVANVIYIESPACVGFSYSNTSSDCTVGDQRTSSDLVEFLKQFFIEFPQFSTNELWITGESYGGHYVPNFTQAIFESISSGELDWNLQGFAVGNGWTDANSDNSGSPLMWVSHALIPFDVYDGIMSTCDFNTIGPLVKERLRILSPMGNMMNPFNSNNSTLNATQCNNYLNTQGNLMAGINIYDLYSDICLSNDSPIGPGEQLINMIAEDENYVSSHRILKNAMKSQREYVNSLPNSFAKNQNRNSRRRSQSHGNVNNNEFYTQIPDPDPCIQNHLTSYLNLPAVQQSMYVTGPVKQWSGCSSTVNYSRSDLLTSMIPVYQNLMNQSKLKLYFLSGDIDGIVSIAGSRIWLDYLNYFIISTSWAPWTDSNKQTGGFTQVYKTPTSSNVLNFVTVRDAGHMIPYTQPGRSLDVMTRIFSHEQV